MYDSLEAQLIAAKGNKAYIMHSAFIPVKLFASCCAFLDFDMGNAADTLELDCSDREESEKLKLYQRTYGSRIFKLTDIGANHVTKYVTIMASGTLKFEYDVKKQMMRSRVPLTIASSTFTITGGAPITPSCAEPENMLQWHFSFESLTWKRGPNRDRPWMVDRQVGGRRAERCDMHFGMNGTEL